LLFFLSARALATIAYQMSGVAVAWQVYNLSGSAFALGLVGLVQFIPSLLLALFVGHVADRYDRRRIVALAQLAEGSALAGLVIMIILNRATVEMIFLFIFSVGIARAFEYTTLQTLLPSLAEKEQLPRAMAVNSSVTQCATIIGPMLGGFLYAAGPEVVYGASAIMFLYSAFTISRLNARPFAPIREPVTMSSLFAGIAFIRSRPVVFGAISLDLFAVLLGGATALLPVYARDILNTGPVGLGLLRSAPSVGALAGALFLASHPLNRNVGRIMFTAVATFGLMTIVFALSRSIVLTLITLAALGCADMISVVIRASLVQLETPDEMRGRVSAVNAVFIGTSNHLGEFESGLTAAWFGVVPAAFLGGVGTIVVVLLWMWLFPALLLRERLQRDS
jgi:MFS family permease